MAYNYDAQISAIGDDPEKLRRDWAFGKGLFSYIGSRFARREIKGIMVSPGCLTQVRNNPSQRRVFIKGELDEELTQQIAADERIPKSGGKITIKHLPIFKEWRLKIDALEES